MLVQDIQKEEEEEKRENPLVRAPSRIINPISWLLGLESDDKYM